MLEASIKTLQKIQSFAHLPHGWCYGSGEPLSPEAIGHAINWLRSLVKLNLIDNNAFPGADGEIIISVYIGVINIDLSIYQNGEASLIVENGEEEIGSFSCFALRKVRDVISMVLAAIWNTSASFTQNTSTAVWDGSKVLPSKTLLRAEGHRFSNSSVVSKNQVISAPTSNSSIQTWGVNRQSIGFLKPIIFRKEAA